MSNTWYGDHRHAEIEEFKGMTFKAVQQIGGDEIRFLTHDDRTFVMYHAQDCCEDVSIEDITGDLRDLVDSPILLAECVTSDENPKSHYDDSHTWTFYKLATVKGYVTIRWYGTSNGYYSEDVQIEERRIG